MIVSHENVTEATDDCEDSFIEGHIPQLDGEPAQGFIENDGKEAFECLQCKLLFIPGSHMHGNTIFEYEACRRHYGVSKCKNCALPLISLDRMRAHWRDAMNLPDMGEVGPHTITPVFLLYQCSKLFYISF